MARELTFRIFIGDRPYEELTAEERTAFSRQAVKRMGDALQDYYSRHPEEYKNLPDGGGEDCGSEASA